MWMQHQTGSQLSQQKVEKKCIDGAKKYETIIIEMLVIIVQPKIGKSISVQCLYAFKVLFHDICDLCTWCTVQ